MRPSVSFSGVSRSFSYLCRSSLSSITPILEELTVGGPVSPCSSVWLYIRMDWARFAFSPASISAGLCSRGVTNVLSWEGD